MALQPLYTQGEAVYLRDSAALGFLEAYIVDTIVHEATGVIRYNLITHLKPPTANMTMGDRNRGRVPLQVSVLESDLITFCDAVALAIENTERQLANLQAQQVSMGCLPPGTDGTG